MKLAIRYEADYQYETEASFSPHLARLFPRPDASLLVNRSEFSTNAGADVQHRRDLFDNLIASCFYPQPQDHLTYRLALDLTLEPKNPFHFLLDSQAMQIPFLYAESEAAVLAPFLARPEPMKTLPGPLDHSGTARPTVEALVEMISWLHTNISYERRDEGAPFPPAQTLSEQRGSCRDFAVLCADLLRHHGLAARLVSGFLWEEKTEERRAENALHAWVDAYLPGAGWIGLDPTNGVLCDHHALATCVGLTPEDIAPIQGRYYGKNTIASTLKTCLTITAP